MEKTIEFSDEVIQKLFGHEAAEDEDISRLKEYYFKNKTYTRITADLPLRILVGHKGIGKSALFKIAMSEDNSNNTLSILLRPDDIIGLYSDNSDFLKAIRDWKDGLNEILAKKILSSLGLNDESNFSKALNIGGKLTTFLLDTLKPSCEKIDLTSSKGILINNFIKSNKINIYIDDLDRGWKGKKEDIFRISALLNAIRDISNQNKGINFKIALRADVYYLVRTSDESTDKIEGSVVWFSWTNHEILALLIKRIKTFFGEKIDEEALMQSHQYVLSEDLKTVMEPRFTGHGKWENAPMYRVLMSLIRKRPRDLVKLCTLAAHQAYEKKHTIIYTSDFKAIFEEYSQGRIQDTINEYRSELPDIERLIMSMKPSQKERKASMGYMYKTDALLTKIQNITEQGTFTLANGATATPKELAQFMYKINFITARKGFSGEGQGIVRKYFEENRYLSNQFSDFGFDWEVHPAYRWALQPSDISKIYDELELSTD